MYYTTGQRGGGNLNAAAIGATGSVAGLKDAVRHEATSVQISGRHVHDLTAKGAQERFPYLARVGISNHQNVSLEVDFPYEALHGQKVFAVGLDKGSQLFFGAPDISESMGIAFKSIQQGQVAIECCSSSHRRCCDVWSSSSVIGLLVGPANRGLGCQ